MHHEKVYQVLVYADQALRGVGDDRRKTNDEGHHHHRGDARANPKNYQRRNGDDGHGLQKNRVGIYQLAQPAPLGKDHRHGHTNHDACQQPAGRFFPGDRERIQERRESLARGKQNRHRRIQ